MKPPWAKLIVRVAEDDQIRTKMFAPCQQASASTESIIATKT
ncbi:hypothetical protein [Altererythrobacter sp. TH136]|nr:hypothetical protein [Altererythrobacter sp. TH136]